MATAAVQSNISSTLSRIDTALTGGTLTNPITKENVAEVAKLLTALSPSDLKTIIADMARSGKLQVFAQELTDTTLFVGGLSKPEQGAFYGAMARSLDSGSLAQLYGAFVSSDKSKGDYSAVYGLTDAISKHTAPAAQLEFLRVNAPRITAGETLITSTLGGVTAQYGFDATAYTSGLLISKLPANFVEPAIRSLSDAQLAQLVRSGVGAETLASAAGATV